jgi:hypothetical protein
LNEPLIRVLLALWHDGKFASESIIIRKDKTPLQDAAIMMKNDDAAGESSLS